MLRIYGYSSICNKPRTYPFLFLQCTHDHDKLQMGICVPAKSSSSNKHAVVPWRNRPATDTRCTEEPKLLLACTSLETFRQHPSPSRNLLLSWHECRPCENLTTHESSRGVCSESVHHIAWIVSCRVLLYLLENQSFLKENKSLISPLDGWIEQRIMHHVS